MTQTLPPAPSPNAAVPVDMISPTRWIERGWEDLRANPLPGMLHGLALALFGWLLLWLARDRFWLLAGAFSGFLIVAPILATGLYHVSKEAQAGRKAGLAALPGPAPGRRAAERLRRGAQRAGDDGSLEQPALHWPAAGRIRPGWSRF